MLAGTALSTLVWNGSYGMGNGIHVLTSWGFGNLVMAAIIVAGLGAVLAVITIIGGLIQA